MALPLYLAMTPAEIRGNSHLPPKLGYMACHFSPYGTGLSGCPESLPEGALLILNDRTPIYGHDHDLIAQQLEELVKLHRCCGVLLDFQRPGFSETSALVKRITELPCSTAVSEQYAEGVDCPVFLPPVPLDVPLAEYIAPWQGRKVWLEAALEGTVITLSPEGAACTPLPAGKCMEGGHQDEKLHCHYQIQLKEDARFTLYRTREDVDALLSEAERLGVKMAVGLWQEFH